ncbi:MAG: hypothetical protein ACE5DX_03675 [Candidatus Dojkabacteria bacterium]
MLEKGWPVVEPFKAVELEGSRNKGAGRDLVDALREHTPEKDVVALVSFTISESGYVEIDPTTPSEHVFGFVSTINRMLPADWGDMYMGEVDLVNPQVYAGKMERSRMLPLSSGLDGNRLAFLLTGQINESKSIIAQTHILAAERVVELMRNEELTDLQRRQAAKLALHVFTPLVRLYELPELMQRLQDNAFSLLDPAGYVRTLTQWRREFWEPVDQDSLVQTLTSEFAQTLGLPGEAITVEYRLKSLLSYAQKSAEGRSKHGLGRVQSHY